MNVQKILKTLSLVWLCFIVLTVHAQQYSKKQPKADAEFRAAWVASVANINWPSKPGLTTEQQKQEALNILNILKNNNLNAVIFQVRPQADALYKSDLEPWSYFLTGKQGVAPNPYYDPLEFWIDAAHERGLELHVWLNPYRAHHVSGKEISEKSIVKTNPELVYKLAEGYWWLDPSLKGTQDHSAAVVRDIVSRYDIDGVHFDDYFYPYESYNKGADFPDQKTYQDYLKTGGTLALNDWRRESVNTFIKRVYDEIKSIKTHVKFGLSPFGIWRPGYPESIEGMDQYEKLYADAKLWLNEGWIDYFSPQLYWKVNTIAQSYPVLLGWWERENKTGKHLWPGLNSGLGGGPTNSDEIFNQIMIARGIVPNSPGHIHWSMAALQTHESLRKDLLAGPYKRQALVPPSPWLEKEQPAVPKVTTQLINNNLEISWEAEGADKNFRYVVYAKYGDNWEYQILNKHDRCLLIPTVQTLSSGAKIQLTAYGVTAVGRTGNESRFEEKKL